MSEALPVPGKERFRPTPTGGLGDDMPVIDTVPVLDPKTGVTMYYPHGSEELRAPETHPTENELASAERIGSAREKYLSELEGKSPGSKITLIDQFAAIKSAGVELTRDELAELVENLQGDKVFGAQDVNIESLYSNMHASISNAGSSAPPDEVVPPDAPEEEVEQHEVLSDALKKAVKDYLDLRKDGERGGTAFHDVSEKLSPEERSRFGPLSAAAESVLTLEQEIAAGKHPNDEYDRMYHELNPEQQSYFKDALRVAGYQLEEDIAPAAPVVDVAPLTPPASEPILPAAEPVPAAAPGAADVIHDTPIQSEQVPLTELQLDEAQKAGTVRNSPYWIDPRDGSSAILNGHEGSRVVVAHGGSQKFPNGRGRGETKLFWHSGERKFMAQNAFSASPVPPATVTESTGARRDAPRQQVRAAEQSGPVFISDFVKARERTENRTSELLAERLFTARELSTLLTPDVLEIPDAEKTDGQLALAKSQLQTFATSDPARLERAAQELEALRAYKEGPYMMTLSRIAQACKNNNIKTESVLAILRKTDRTERIRELRWEVKKGFSAWKKTASFFTFGLYGFFSGNRKAKQLDRELTPQWNETEKEFTERKKAFSSIFGEPAAPNRLAA